MSIPARVLVTGASGHVGGAIALALAEAGCEVVALSRRALAPRHEAITLLQGDIGNAENLNALPACDAIVHAAAVLGKGLDNPEISRTNAVGTHHLVALADRWGKVPFVFISGVGVIGQPLIHPVTEDHPVHPVTAYHVSKLYGEHLTGLYGGIVLRASSPVGANTPGDRIFPTFVRKALAGEVLMLQGKGLRRQDYVDVRDIAAAVLLCLGRRAEGVFNIASGNPVSNAELAQTCVSTLQSNSAIQIAGDSIPDDSICWDISLDRARDMLGYAPKYTLAHSIRACAESLSV